MADPVTVARWVGEAGWPADSRVKAVAVALAESGGNEAKPGGLWGVGGSGDGPAQARHALGIYQAQGWKPFPAAGSGRDVLMMPVAVGAVAGAGIISTPNPISKAAEAADTAGQQARATFDLTTTAAAMATYLTTEGAWRRIVKFSLGVTLMAISAYKISSGVFLSPLRRGVAKTARTAAAVAPAAAPAIKALKKGVTPSKAPVVRSPADTEVVEVRK